MEVLLKLNRINGPDMLFPIVPVYIDVPIYITVPKVNMTPTEVQ